MSKKSKKFQSRFELQTSRIKGGCHSHSAMTYTQFAVISRCCIMNRRRCYNLLRQIKDIFLRLSIYWTDGIAAIIKCVCYRNIWTNITANCIFVIAEWLWQLYFMQEVWSSNLDWNFFYFCKVKFCVSTYFTIK